MESIAILIPLSILFIAFAALVFVWAVNDDQFDALDTHGFDILDTDEPQPPTGHKGET